jgi:hypothetical protein
MQMKKLLHIVNFSPAEEKNMYSIMQSPGYNWSREDFHNEHNIMFLNGNYYDSQINTATEQGK